MNERDGVNRRNVLKIIGSGIGLGGITSVSGARSPAKVTIPLFKSFDGEVIEETTVPRPWLTHIRQARRAKNRLSEQVTRGERVIEGISLKQSNETYGGLQGRQIEVETKPGHVGKATNNIPDHIDNIPVTVTEKIEGENVSSEECVNTGSYSAVPAGVMITMEGVDGYGTTGWYGTVNDREVMWTAGHNFEGLCGGLGGEKVYQGGDEFGEVIAYSEELDVAAIEPTSSSRSVDQSVLLPESGNRYPISGYLPKESVELFYENQATVHKVSVTTGQLTGTLDGTGYERNDDSCITHLGEGVRIGIDAAGGDSGSPIFAPYDGKGYMIAMTQHTIGYDIYDNIEDGAIQCGPEDKWQLVRKGCNGSAAYTWFA